MTDFDHSADTDADIACNDDTMSNTFEREQWVALAMEAATRSLRSTVPAEPQVVSNKLTFCN